MTVTATRWAGLLAALLPFFMVLPLGGCDQQDKAERPKGDPKAVAGKQGGEEPPTLPPADPVPTKLTVPDLDCENCAKKAIVKLEAVSGVCKVKLDIKAKLLIVTPKQGAVVSPRSLWEAVEEGDYEPTKLEGPGGSFATKPKT